MDYDKVAEAITEKTKAIVAVDLGGIIVIMIGFLKL